MDLLITILAVIFILFGIGLCFLKGLINFLAAMTYLFAGMYAYDTKSLIPLFIGFLVAFFLQTVAGRNK